MQRCFTNPKGVIACKFYHVAWIEYEETNAYHAMYNGMLFSKVTNEKPSLKGIQLITYRSSNIPFICLFSWKTNIYTIWFTFNNQSVHQSDFSQHLSPALLAPEWGVSQDQEWQGVRPGRQKHNKHQPVIILTWWGQTPAWWGSPCYHCYSFEDIGGFGRTGSVCQAEEILVKNFS